MRLCDNCKRPPVAFQIESDCQTHGETKETAYWFRVGKDGDPVVLWSDGASSFCACMDENPPDEAEYNFFCKTCFDAMIEHQQPETD